MGPALGYAETSLSLASFAEHPLSVLHIVAMPVKS